MTEEQIKQKFKETYPDFMRGDEPLSPYFDLFESGYEQAEAEERINTLEYRCENIKDTDTMELVALQRQIADLEAQLEQEKNLSQCRLDHNEQLREMIEKAKELLKQWVELYKPKLEGYPIPPIQEQTEQFLSEVEK